jgi:DNA-binding NtrC family response regulator
MNTAKELSQTQSDNLLPVNIIGNSEALQKVTRMIKRVAGFDVTVSIFGETGTGKELVARSLHYLSPRAGGPFVPVNCGSIPDTLVESELFGHKRGAFTDAQSDRVGYVERAQGGTLFLDEVETLTNKAQVTLLRFLEDMQYRPVGDSALKKADLRIIVASNIDLRELQRNNDIFRSDLFYRLDVLPIRLPPLRERGADVVLLAEHFLNEFKLSHDLDGKYFADATLQWLTKREWPGNVRDLKNSVLRGLLLSEGDEILPRNLQHGLSDDPDSLDESEEEDITVNMPFGDAKTKTVNRFECDYLSHILQECRGNISEAARRANTERSTLTRLIKKHQINHREFAIS